ncbi:chryseobasin-related MNIO class RiPP peptide [Hymenobacter actinosclerus]|uniref:Uncharacterized protein n=1 Tax=Hymenobacter actinosclerus TaxID=82805 RepID=A0A1I0BHC7_9BACT|nr:hypothetical protein [Hymenobacter actinosclerus]SET05626.1 hypothetical protein SAMN04487998_1054 [Hymenobacter actinosclerus]
MKIPQAVLGALLVGLAAQTTGCIQKNEPVVKQEQAKPKAPAPEPYSDPCPACGMG